MNSWPESVFQNSQQQIRETKNEGHIQGALLLIWCWFQAVYLDIVVDCVLRVSGFENDRGYMGVKATSGLSVS